MAHDDQNVSRINQVFHLAGTAAERGLSAIGKYLYRTDTGTVEVCTDVTPDEDLAGGGTWASLLTGITAWEEFTPNLTAGGGNPSIDIAGGGAEAGYITLGPLCVAWYYIQFGPSMTAGSGTWRLDKPVAAEATASGNWCVGSGLIVDQSTGATKLIILENRAPGDLYLTYDTNTVAHNLPWSWAAGDEIRAFVIYPIA